jgi:predicted RNase H-like nuclease (RuvC/YqgF family)
MSASGEAENPERKAFRGAEAAVGRLLKELTALRARTLQAEERVAEVELLLRKFTKGDADPAGLERKTKALEDENAELRRRLEQGRDGVDRLLARIRFIEEQAS